MSHHYRKHIVKTNAFRRDAKRCVNRSGIRGCSRSGLLDLMEQIVGCDRVDDEYDPHRLTHQYNRAWEAHLDDDCLLLWDYEDEDTVRFIRMGSHDELDL